MSENETLSGRSIAVTGGNGGLGQVIVDTLSSCGGGVTSVDIRAGRPGVRSRYADVTSLDGLRHALAGHDTVVHVAAMLSPSDPADQMFQVNVLGTWNVLHVAKELGVRKVVLISSETASGIITIAGAKPAKPEYLPIDEAHPLRPCETYGLSKQVGEVMAASFVRDSELEIVVLRPTLILMAGWEQYVEKTRQIDDPELWSYVVVWDVADAVRRAVQLEGVAYASFYLSADDTFSKEPTLDFMQRKFGAIEDVRDRARYEANPHASIWDTSHARRVLGFEPQFDWRRFLELSDSRRGQHG